MIHHSLKDFEEVAEYLFKRIDARLRMGQYVLLLVPGGSSIAVAVSLAKRFRDNGTPITLLTVMLTDERYGPVGHKDSNLASLTDAGFSIPGACVHPVLTGVSLDETTEVFLHTLQKALSTCSYRIGLFGIGADGHTAGILPDSVAVNAGNIVASYRAGIFERITITPKGIRELDEVVAYAYGKEKWTTIITLLATGTSVAKQPAQSLKSIPNFTLFSDYPSTDCEG